MSRSVRAGDPSRRTKFAGASCGEQLKSHPSFGQAGENIALFCLIGDCVHPYRTNYYDGPISSRGRQLNRDIAEVPRASDRNVANVASSMMTAPLNKSGPCSGKRTHQHV